MESIIQFIFENAHLAHWLIFGALMLAGMNVPISEDLMVIMGAVLAATVIPENLYWIFGGVFLGCYLSDWVCYWIGRKFGPKLWNIRWFAKSVSKKRIDQIHNYYEKYGFLTLLVGRFIPFGVRNCLFLTAGIGRMHFGKFIVSDGIACIVSNLTLFSIAYYAGKKYQTILPYLKTFNVVIFALFVLSIIGIIWYKKRVSKPKKTLE